MIAVPIIMLILAIFTFIAIYVSVLVTIAVIIGVLTLVFMGVVPLINGENPFGPMSLITGGLTIFATACGFGLGCGLFGYTFLQGLLLTFLFLELETGIYALFGLAM